MSEINVSGSNNLVIGLAAGLIFSVCGILGISLVSVFFGVSVPTSFTIELAAKAGLDIDIFCLALGGVLSLVSIFFFYVLFLIAQGRFPSSN